jgi:RimJ/RimL family protein N-acetyltransferase
MRLDVTRLASFIVADNARSARVAEKLGAVQDGATTIRGFAVDWWVHRK